MTMDPFARLATAVTVNDDWPTSDTCAEVVASARSFVQAVAMRGEMIEQMRANVTANRQALTELLGSQPKETAQ